MVITKKRIYKIEKDTVFYEDVEETRLIITRSVAEHITQLGKDPAIGQIVSFKTWYDYDGSVNVFNKLENNNESNQVS